VFLISVLFRYIWIVSIIESCVHGQELVDLMQPTQPVKSIRKVLYTMTVMKHRLPYPPAAGIPEFFKSS
jgi:hypothetical protein